MSTTEIELNFRYSVIYEFDCRSTDAVSEFNPPQNQRRRNLWQLTEDDGEYASKQFCNCHVEETCWCGWRFGKHRKWAAILDQKQFDEFVSHCGLTSEDVRTGGSIGAPGFGVGQAPAIAFNGSDRLYYHNAYVTPCPPEGDEFWPDEETWERVRRQVIDHYN